MGGPDGDEMFACGLTPGYLGCRLELQYGKRNNDICMCERRSSRLIIPTDSRQ